uniref:flagellar protein MotY n=1 Tax=Pseudomonas nitroreducens TaxID=46680 RepID=UPI0028A84977
MRQPSLLLLTLCASLPAWGLTFQPRLESAQWTVAGDQFECRLSQSVGGFGVGEFVWRAGEQPTFRLKSQQGWLGTGSATLLAAAPPWRPGQGDLNLGSVSVGSGEVPFNSTQQQAGRLLGGLLEGRTPEVRHRTRTGENLLVRLLPARFADGYAQFQECSTVNRIELDGHSDNSGNRLANREASRRRAIAVMDYLKANGVAESQITVRFYGERYPLVKNNSAANRAKNRRVTVNLSREAVTEDAPGAP